MIEFNSFINKLIEGIGIEGFPPGKKILIPSYFIKCVTQIEFLFDFVYNIKYDLILQNNAFFIEIK